MLKAVLFDMDDTLLDWSGFTADWMTLERRHVSNVYEYIRAQGHTVSPFDSYMQEFHRRAADAWSSARLTMRAPHVGRVLIESAEAIGVPANRLDMRQCLEVYRWGGVPGTRLFPEVRAVLATLHARGLKIGLITNAFQPMWMRDVEMQTHDLLDYFVDCRISAADHGFLKPHPSIFQSALTMLGVTAEESVFVGDNLEADIGGAHAVGMRAVLRLVARAEQSSNPDVVPDASIHSLDELMPLLDEWFPGWHQG